MKDLLSAIKDVITKKTRVNYRDRRSHYASSGLKCLRDQYWERTGEEKTNPPDMLGCMKMAVGSAVGDYIAQKVLANLHWVGYHMVGAEVPVGFSDPNVDGYLDALMAKRNENGNWEQFVIELKTKSGYGADLLMQNFEPSDDYLSQLGLYLKDLDQKGVTNKGMLLYILLSDKNFGELVQINCKYDSETDMIKAYEAITSTGLSRPLDCHYRVGKTIERYEALDKHIAQQITPKPDYKYKYELTPEFIADLSDAKIKSILSGRSIGGDWQPLYSSYKNKQLEVDGILPERTFDELNLLLTEWRRRHPRSRYKTLDDFRN